MTPFQRALDGIEDRIFRLTTRQRAVCVAGIRAQQRRGVGQGHPVLSAFAAGEAHYRDRQIASIAAAHRCAPWWLPVVLLWNSLTSGVDVFEYAVSWYLVTARWCPHRLLGPMLAALALACADVRRAQAQGSRVPTWCLAWQRAPIMGFKVCAWRVGILTGWQWGRSDGGHPVAPDYAWLPSPLRVALIAVSLAALCWPDHAHAGITQAALSGAIVWEAQTGGSDNNGGGFKAGASGTDRSQQASAQVNIDNSAITTSIATSVITFTGGYAPSAADVGNVVQMLTGTNVTAGFYEITSMVAGTSWTVDRNVVTSGTTTNATGKMGGAVASVGKIVTSLVAGNSIYVKAGTYSITSASTNVAAGCLNLNLTNNAPVWLEGYQATRGDLGTAPVFQASSISTFTLLAEGIAGLRVANLTLDGASLTSSRGINGTDARANHYLVTAKNCTNTAFSGQGNYLRCRATGCSTTTVANLTTTAFGCELDANTVIAWNANQAGATLAYSLVRSNTGGSTDGASPATAYLVNVVLYGNGRDGMRNASGGTTFCVNTIAEGNTGVGFNTLATSTIPSCDLLNCAGCNNTGGNTSGTFRSNLNFLTLAASPFTNAAGGDFSLNTTASAGAACRAAGYPGLFPAGTTTGYLDVGAAQHADPASGVILYAVE